MSRKATAWGYYPDHARYYPTMLGTTLIMLGTTPTMLGTTPTMRGTSPTMRGTWIFPPYGAVVGETPTNQKLLHAEYGPSEHCSSHVPLGSELWAF